MLVHPNPMAKLKTGDWEDTHLQRVQVRAFRLNSGNHRKRWVVYARRRVGGPWDHISRHITEEQAVVSAQTLANRLYRSIKKKERSKIKKRPPLVVTPEQGEDMLRKLNLAVTQAQLPADIGNHVKARDEALDVLRLIRQAFNL